MSSLLRAESIECVGIRTDQNGASPAITPSGGGEEKRMLPGSSTSGCAEVKKDKDDTPAARSRKQKRVKRIVIIVGTVMLLMAVVLVAVTLIMAGHIDEKVREVHDTVVTPAPSRGGGPSTRDLSGMSTPADNG